MKKLLKNTNPHTKEVLYVFEDEQTGQMISNPLWNPEMTSHALPERYGFKVWDTGGGCTAHGQEFSLDGQSVILLLTDGEMSHVTDKSENVCNWTLWGYHDHSENEMGLWEVAR
jgi:hypothetical protein